MNGVNGALNADAACSCGRVFLYLRWQMRMILHTQIKQIALMVVTMPKAWSGISLLKRAPAEMTSVDTNNPLLGTWFLFSFANLDGPWSFLLKLYKIRLVENIPLLQAEAAEVSTTKLIIPAASGIPTKLKVLTNGLSAAFNSIHGLINNRTISAPT